MSWLGDLGKSVLGSVAGGLIGSFFGDNSAEKQQRRNEEMMALQNQYNVENYQHRYQWQMADMRAAGLNPILSANLGAGAPAASSLAGVGMAQPTGIGDIGANTNSAQKLSVIDKKNLELQQQGLDIQSKRNDEMTANEAQNIKQQGEQIASQVSKNLADIANNTAKTNADIENQKALTAAQIDSLARQAEAAMISASASSAMAATGQYKAEIEAGLAEYQKNLFSADQLAKEKLGSYYEQMIEQSKANIEKDAWKRDPLSQDWYKVGNAIHALSPVSGWFD